MRRVPSCTLAPLGLASVLTGCAGGTKRALETRHDLEALHAEAVTAPQSPQPWYRMALVHADQQRYDEALRAAQAALQRDADYEPALTFMAKLFYEQLVAGPAPEDAAPPAETKPDAAAKTPPNDTESSDDTSHE